MEIEYLKEFVILAEGNSYLEASEILYISQSSLSKHIKRLEKELGCMLFKRTTRRVELSEYGRLLLPYARNIIRSYDEFYEAMEQQDERVLKKLTIGSTSLMAVYGITDILARFRAENPGLALDLIEGTNVELMDLMKQGRCDYSFIRCVDWKDDEEYSGITIDTDEMVAIIGKEHPLAGKDAVSLEDLKDESFLLMQGQELIYELSLKFVSNGRFNPRIGFVGSNSSTIVEMAGRGEGVSLLMRKPAMRTCAFVPSVCIVPIEPPVVSDVVLIYRNSVKITPVRASFLNCVEAFLREKIHT